MMTTAPSNISHSRQRMTENCLLIWLTMGIDETNNIVDHLQNDVDIFTNPNDCIDFLTDLEDTMAFLIIDETIGEQIIPLIHDIPQLDNIYIFCKDKSPHNEWIKDWPKVKDVYPTIESIRDALQLAVKQYKQDSIAMSFVPDNEIDDKLEPSFMYTQIFKEILLQMKYDEKSINNFITFCRSGNRGSSINIDLLEKDYHNKTAIWWYTHPSFISSMLNYALRTLETDVIIKMGFFIYDLHHEIEELHRKQLSSYDDQSFIVYRGQGLLETDFQRLEKTKGGLMSFNNFLSTSRDQHVSLTFAQSSSTMNDMLGILFVISIDPSVSSTPFASIDEISYFKTEEKEILFSMHTVFRINEIKSIHNNNRLYQVDLQLTADDDEQLRILTKYIGNEIGGDTGWKRLGSLLYKIHQLDQAEELYNVLLEQASNDDDKIHYYHELSIIKFDQADYEASVWYNGKIIEIEKKMLPVNDLSLATSSDNIGLVCCKTGDYSKILTFYDKSVENIKLSEDYLPLTNTCDNIRKRSSVHFHEKALETYHRTLAADYPHVSTSYDNIIGISEDMTEDSKRIAFYEKLLEVRQKFLPPNHPDFVLSYHNIAKMYDKREEHLKALEFHEKSLEILEKTLPLNHPHLGIVYGSMGSVYINMKEYSKALEFYEKALVIFQQTLPSNHPSLTTSYKNIGLTYNNLEEYSKEVEFYEKALEIYRKTLPSNHPDLAYSYESIASAYHRMEEYPKALEFYKKTIEICREILPSSHPDLATSYNNIGLVYHRLGEYSEALQFHKKAFEIYEKTLPPNYPHWAVSCGNIPSVYNELGEYSKALLFYKKAIEIYQKNLPSSHPDLATSYSNIGSVYDSLEEYSEALQFHEKALEIFQETLPSSHPDLASCYNNIGSVYYKMEEYTKALKFHEKALEICEETHPSLAIFYQNIGSVYYHIEEYSKALSYFECALNIFKISPHPNHSGLQGVKDRIEIVKEKLQIEFNK